MRPEIAPTRMPIQKSTGRVVNGRDGAGWTVQVRPCVSEKLISGRRIMSA
jgi:hypothetical protein